MHTPFDREWIQNASNNKQVNWRLLSCFVFYYAKEALMIKDRPGWIPAYLANHGQRRLIA
jgi:hypothetical protein